MRIHKILESLLYLTIFIFITNGIFLGVNFYLGSSRPLIVLDYIFLIILFLLPISLFKRSLLYIVLFSILFFVDCLLWIRQFYPFMRFTDIVFLVKLIGDGPLIYKKFLLIGILILVLEIFFSLYILRHCNKRQISLTFLTCLIVVILPSYLLQNSLAISEKDDNYRLNGYVRSYIAYIFKLQDNLLYQQLQWTAKLAPSKYQSADNDWWRTLSSDQSTMPRKMLLVVNESWGKPIDLNIEKDVLKQLIYSEHVEIIKSGELPFIGATVDGEMRELCKIKSSNFNIRSIETGFEQCLPNQLKRKLDYLTFSLHGANSTVYDRNYWYGKVGFGSQIFFENLDSPVLCHSFSGACDKQLFNLINNTFKEYYGKKIFYYWLTLNTHYPYDLRDLKSDRFNCTMHALVLDSEECRNLRLQTQYFDNLAALFNSPYMKGTEVIIVGDHAPPIIQHASTSVFKQNKISYLHLKIK